MYEPAKRGHVPDAFADRVRDSHPDADADADKLTDSVALADHVAIVRSVERTLDQRRVGARRGNSPLPIV
jgi:hypothetical protein